ncbi:MAG: hypothetical protein ACOWWO_04340 [Peptococcaceae bacterium]
MNCLLEKGCPCNNLQCPNHGDCAKCIKRHLEEVEAKVYCMREENRTAIK